MNDGEVGRSQVCKRLCPALKAIRKTVGKLLENLETS